MISTSDSVDNYFEDFEEKKTPVVTTALKSKPKNAKRKTGVKKERVDSLIASNSKQKLKNLASVSNMTLAEFAGKLLEIGLKSITS